MQAEAFLGFQNKLNQLNHENSKKFQAVFKYYRGNCTIM